MVDEVWSDGYRQASVDGVAVKFEDAKAGIKRILDELRMKS
jgi:hypothetical protein